MARPTTIKDGVKLNLYVPKKAKQAVFKLASSRHKSMSSVIVEMIMAQVQPKAKA